MDNFVDAATLESFREAYETELSRHDGIASVQATFNYAYCLVQQPKKRKNDILKGIKLLRGLYDLADDDKSRRDYLYYNAIGYYKVGYFEEAIKLVEAILMMEPDNKQAIDLREEIVRERKRDGLTGAAITGGLVVFGGVLGSLIVLGSMLSKSNK